MINAETGIPLRGRPKLRKKTLSINSFIVQRKERYHIPHVIVIFITMPLAAPNGAVTSLSLEYPQASRYELHCSRVPFLSTNMRSSCHDICCDRNTTARPIQMEDKDLIIHCFIIQWKERYLRPRFIVISISITMLLAAPNCGVPSLSLYYSQVSRHELRCSRFPLLFLILRFFLIIYIKLCMRMRQV